MPIAKKITLLILMKSRPVCPPPPSVHCCVQARGVGVVIGKRLAAVVARSSFGVLSPSPAVREARLTPATTMIMYTQALLLRGGVKARGGCTRSTHIAEVNGGGGLLKNSHRYGFRYEEFGGTWGRGGGREGGGGRTFSVCTLKLIW